MPKIKLSEKATGLIMEVCLVFWKQGSEMITVFHHVQDKMCYLPAEVQ